MKSIVITILIAGVLCGGLHLLSHPVMAEETAYGGDIVYAKPVKGVIFSHKAHVDDLGLSCNMCHDKLFQMDALNAQKNDDFTMKSLYSGKYCGACHDGKTAFASNTQCARCHIGVKGYDKAQKAAKK